MNTTRMAMFIISFLGEPGSLQRASRWRAHTKQIEWVQTLHPDIDIYVYAMDYTDDEKQLYTDDTFHIETTTIDVAESTQTIMIAGRAAGTRIIPAAQLQLVKAHPTISYINDTKRPSMYATNKFYQMLYQQLLGDYDCVLISDNDMAYETLYNHKDIFNQYMLGMSEFVDNKIVYLKAAFGRIEGYHADNGRLRLAKSQITDYYNNTPLTNKKTKTKIKLDELMFSFDDDDDLDLLDTALHLQLTGSNKLEGPGANLLVVDQQLYQRQQTTFHCTRETITQSGIFFFINTKKHFNQEFYFDEDFPHKYDIDFGIQLFSAGLGCYKTKSIVMKELDTTSVILQGNNGGAAPQTTESNEIAERRRRDLIAHDALNAKWGIPQKTNDKKSLDFKAFFRDVEHTFVTPISINKL